jgi:hypothetical protein
MGIRDTTTWTVRRYYLSTYDEKALDSDIQAWVKQQGLSIKRAPGLFLDDIMDTTYFIPLEAYNRGQASLAIRYLVPILYVYTSHHLPDAVRRINEIIATYSDTRGGRGNSKDPRTFRKSKLLSPHKAFEKLDESSPAQEGLKIIVTYSETRVRDEMRPTEQYLVAPWAKEIITRSRTIQDAINIEWSEMRSAELSATFKAFLNTKISGTIQKKRATSHTESEQLSKTIELPGGERGRKYELFWNNVWLKGEVKILWDNKTMEILPFECLDRVERASGVIDSPNVT